MPLSFTPIVSIHPRKKISVVSDKALFHFRNRLCRIQALWTSARTVKDSMAPIQARSVIDLRQALASVSVARVRDPPITLQQDGGAQILGLVPPVGRTGGAAAGTQNAFEEPVQLGALRGGLPVLAAVGGGGVGLQIRLDGAVLFVEMRHVWN
jgi:hypothetical protein